MTNFIDSFIRNTPIGKIKDSISLTNLGFSANSTDGALGIINQIYTLLSKEVQVCGEFIPSLVYDYEVMPDFTELSSDLDENEPTQYTTEVSEETVDTIVGSLRQSLAFGYNMLADEVNDQPMVITDALGNTYELILQPAGTIIDGVEYIITYTKDPQSFEDALLYRIGDTYYFNSKMRTKGFWRPNLELVLPNTINDVLLSIIDWADVECLDNTIKGMIDAISLKLAEQTYDTIGDAISGIMAALELEQTEEVIFDNLIAILQELYQQYRDRAFGFERYLGDVVGDVMRSDTINNIILTGCDLLRNGKFTVETFTESVKTFVTDAFASAQKLISGIAAAFGSGGILGAAKFIINYMNDGLKISTDEDGVLNFTDNNSLVPEEYIAGLITRVIGSVFSVASAIISFFNPIIGVIGGVLSSVILAIPQAISYDYNNQTKALIRFTDDNDPVNKYPYAPHGFFQYECSKNLVCDEIRECYDSGIYTIFLNVPGGVILCGKGTGDNIRFEFHPALCDVPSVLKFYQRPAGLRGSNTWQDVSEPGQNPHFYYLHYHDASEGERTYLTQKELLDIWATAKPLNINITADGYPSGIGDDARLRFAIMKNTLIFEMFLYSLENEQIPIMTNDGLYQPIFDIGTNFNPEHSRPTFFTYSGSNPELDTYRCILNPLPYLMVDDSILAKIQNKSLVTLSDVGGGVSQSDVDAINTVLYNQLIMKETYLVPLNNIVCSWSNLINFVDASNFGLTHFNELDSYSQLNFGSFYFRNASGVTSGDMRYVHVNVVNLINAISEANFFQTAMEVPQSFAWGIMTPKYERSTFIAWIILFTVVTVAVTVATIVISRKVRKAIRSQQAKNRAAIEKAWSDFSSDTTDENLKKYKSLVFKNNVFAKLTGGTRYSYYDFWQGGTEGSGLTKFSNLISSTKEMFSSENPTIDDIQQTSENTDIGLQIRRLIKTDS